MFRDTYQKLYSNGMWVLEENMKPMLRKKKYVHQEPSYNNYVKESQQREPKIKKQKRKREFEKK